MTGNSIYFETSNLNGTVVKQYDETNHYYCISDIDLFRDTHVSGK